MSYHDFLKREYRRAFPFMTLGISAFFILFSVIKDVFLIGFSWEWFLIRICYIPVVAVAIFLYEKSKFFNRHYEFSAWVAGLYVATYATYFSQNTGKIHSSYALAIVSAIAGLCMLPLKRGTFYGLVGTSCLMFISVNLIGAHESLKGIWGAIFPYLPIISFLLAIYELISVKRKKEYLTKARLTKNLTKQSQIIIRQSEKLAESQTDIRVGRIASQVAHDIRSPLDALSASLFEMKDLNSNSIKRAETAVARLKAISEKLLNSRADYQSEELVNQDVLPFIYQVIDEKRALCSLMEKSIKIRFVKDKSPQHFSLINPLDFTRVLSNILQNAIEAIEIKGHILISVKKTTNGTFLTVIDNGKGIPSNVLPKVFVRGFSFGKRNGHGLGLSHAKETLNSWGGDFQIENRTFNGTKVSISLPTQIVPTVSPSYNVQYVLLDDNLLTHASWQALADKYGVRLLAFFSAAHLFEKISLIPRTSQIYIDYQLGEGQSGVKVALDLISEGFEHVYLATGMRNSETDAIEKIIPVVSKEPPWLEQDLEGSHAAH